MPWRCQWRCWSDSCRVLQGDKNLHNHIKSKYHTSNFIYIYMTYIYICVCVDSFVYLCVSFLHKDRSRIFARWLYQWEFQDTTDGGTLVPYNAILYFVGIFPYIGLIYGRYLQFGFLLHGHWQIPGCHKHRIHHLMIFCRMGSLLYIYNHIYIYVVSNDFSREGMGLIVSFRNQTFFELGFKPFFFNYS